MTSRQEQDTLGLVEVSSRHFWGAQTQRALQHFPQGFEVLPWSVTVALLQIKRAAAIVNQALGLLPESVAAAIVTAADDLLARKAQEEFPLSIWQSGSGTQSHMNVNEVLANHASELLGGPRGLGRLVHPNDHVNLGQSSNDVFPSAMHLAAVHMLSSELFPALDMLQEEVCEKANAFQDVVKLGRTHWMDATPMTLGQELSGYLALLQRARRRIEDSQEALYELALGGSAVGTGLTAHPDFGSRVIAYLAEESGIPWKPAQSRMQALSSDDALRSSHAALAGLAASLHKIANDIRFLGSGPRAGIGELLLPENEPGSSIMPGKVNPTQCEVVVMVSCLVAGNDVSLQMAATQAHCELSLCRPLVAGCYLQSVRLLAATCRNFARFCIADLQPNYERIAFHVDDSLMLVTALVPHLGYDKSAQIARHAHQRGLSLRQAALELRLASAEEVDQWLIPTQMV